MVEEKKVVISFETRYPGLEDAAKVLQNTSNEVKNLADRWKVSTSHIKSAMSAMDAAKAAANAHTNRIRVSNELMKRSGLGVSELSRGLQNMGYVLDKTGKITTLFGKRVKMSEINMKQLRKASIRFKMEYLSVMFAAMAANRILSQMWKGMVTTFQKANEETEGLGKATWHLQAAWEFFKYSLINALVNSEIFKTLVEWLLKVINWFNSLSEGEQTAIALSIGVGLIVTKVIELVAQLGLAKAGFSMLGWGGSTKVIGELSAVDKAFSTFKAGVGLGIAVYFVWKSFEYLKEGILGGDIGKQLIALIVGTLSAAFAGMGFAKLLTALGVGGVTLGGGAIVGAALVFGLGILFKLYWEDKMYEEASENFKRTRTTLEDYRDLLLNSEIDSTKDLFIGVAKEGKILGSEIDTVTGNFKDLIGEYPRMLKGTEDNTTAMQNYSQAISAVNIGNSPTGLIHIIESENNIIALQPIFSLAIKAMATEMDALSKSISSQKDHLTSLISELDRYIRKLEEAARAEKTNKSSGIMGAIKSVIGYKATGGMISQTGPYMLHEGEFVVPRGSPGEKYGSGDITNNAYTVNLSVTGEMSDPEELSRQIMDKLSDELNRLTDSNNT